MALTGKKKPNPKADAVAALRKARKIGTGLGKAPIADDDLDDVVIQRGIPAKPAR